MDSLHKLEELFAHFPGIGPRQARRFIYYLLNKSPSYINEFTKLIDEVRRSTSECSQCHRLFIGKKEHGSGSPKHGETLLCNICSDPTRDQTTLMIVARDSDFETVEKSGAYKGLYFILGGTIPLLDKEPEKRIRLQKLLERVSGTGALLEIIFSLNATPEGENTAEIIREAMKNILDSENIKVTVLGRGISTGAELEYVDSETIRNALMNRQ